MDVPNPKLISVSIFVRTQFEAYHRWLDAPDEVAFLRNFHRHMFHVSMTMLVEGLDRSLEFFMLQKQLKAFIRDKFEGKYFEASCEMIAADIMFQFGAVSVSVSEDGENGAIVVNEAPPVVNANMLKRSAEMASKVKQKITELVREKCFYGTEAEGPDRGCPVLFVPGCVSVPDVLEAFGKVKNKDIRRIYFGAGNIPAVDYQTLSRIIEVTRSTSVIDVEIRGWESLSEPFKAFLKANQGLRIISRSMDDAKNPSVNFVKWCTPNEIVWKERGMGKTYRTAIDDSLFDQDTEL